MPTAWYVERRGHDSQPKPQIVYNNSKPSTDKAPNGAPSQYQRVEPIPAILLRAEPTLDELWDHFNPESTR